MKKQTISVAQKEVWSWKEECYQDVALILNSYRCLYNQ